MAIVSPFVGVDPLLIDRTDIDFPGCAQMAAEVGCMLNNLGPCEVSMNTPNSSAFFDKLCREVENLRKQAHDEGKKLSAYCTLRDGGRFKVYEMRLMPSEAVLLYGVDSRKSFGAVCASIFSIELVMRFEKQAGEDDDFKISGFAADA